MEFCVKFGLELREITSPKKSEMKSLVDQLNCSTSENLFWLLSKMVRTATPEELKPVFDQLGKLSLNHRDDCLGALFLNAHLIRRATEVSHNEAYRWCKNLKFHENPLIAAKIYNIIALPCYASSLQPQFKYLEVNNKIVQKNAAAAIARSSKAPGNLLRRVLVTISGESLVDVEKLTFEKTNSESLRTLGFMYLIECLTNNGISLNEYIKALYPILCKIPENDLEKDIDIEIQKIFANLMMKNPTSFHQINLFTASLAQIKSNNFQPFFLKALIFTYGINAIRKFVSPLIKTWLDRIKYEGLDFIEIISPYCMYLEPQMQLSIHKTIVEECEKRRFDKRLFEIATAIFLSSSPTISPYIGKFIEIVQKTPYSQKFLSSINSLLEPKSQPILHPKRETMKIIENKKKDAFTQITPQLKHVITNCCVSRDIRILPPKPTPSKTELPKVTTGSQVKYNYPISDNKSTAKAEEVPDDLMDFECDIDDE